MNGCDVVTIGNPVVDVVTIGEPYCPESVRERCIQYITDYIYTITGDATPVELYGATIGGDTLLIPVQGDASLFVFMGEEARLFCVGQLDGVLTGESAMMPNSNEKESFIADNNINVLHPDTEFITTLEGYISLMQGQRIIVTE